MVQGISAFILGIIHEFNDDSSVLFTKLGIQNLILSRIGKDVFTGRIRRLSENPYFTQVRPMIYHVLCLLTLEGLCI